MTPADENPAGAERRERPDRRRRPTPMFSRYWLRGRRRGHRRGDERVGGYVDRYRGLEWGLAVGIFLLSLLDLIFTLNYLERGGEEWNPLMAMALDVSTRAFALIKMGITFLGALFLLVHIRFKRVRGLLAMVFGLYCLLTVYHLIIIAWADPAAPPSVAGVAQVSGAAADG